jgi:hypothetical protein
MGPYPSDRRQVTQIGYPWVPRQQFLSGTAHLGGKGYRAESAIAYERVDYRMTQTLTEIPKHFEIVPLRIVHDALYHCSQCLANRPRKTPRDVWQPPRREPLLAFLRRGPRNGARHFGDEQIGMYNGQACLFGCDVDMDALAGFVVNGVKAGREVFQFRRCNVACRVGLEALIKKSEQSVLVLFVPNVSGQIGKTKPLSARFPTRHNIWYRAIRR